MKPPQDTALGLFAFGCGFHSSCCEVLLWLLACLSFCEDKKLHSTTELWRESPSPQLAMQPVAHQLTVFVGDSSGLSLSRGGRLTGLLKVRGTFGSSHPLLMTNG